MDSTPCLSTRPDDGPQRPRAFGRDGVSGLRVASRRGLAAVLAIATLALAGCATTYRLDNQVQSFSSLAAVPAGGYRFERMPLQQSEASQPRVEALAEAALARAGLARNDAAPTLGVQVWGRMQRINGPWVDPWGPGPWEPGTGWGSISGGSRGQVGLGVGIGFGMPFGGYERPWWRREVGVVMRDLATGQVVYETHASHDGPWLDPDRALGAMFDAALHGFPVPPTGQRRVDILLPR